MKETTEVTTSSAPECPSCHDVSGNKVVVTGRGPGGSVSYNCQGCGHDFTNPPVKEENEMVLNHEGAINE